MSNTKILIKFKIKIFVFKNINKYIFRTDCFSVTCNFGSMEVDVDPKLFGLSGNDTVFANGANFDSGSFKYNQPLGDSNQVISIVNDTLNVAVDFEVLSRKKS